MTPSGSVPCQSGPMKTWLPPLPPVARVPM